MALCLVAHMFFHSAWLCCCLQLSSLKSPSSWHFQLPRVPMYMQLHFLSFTCCSLKGTLPPNISLWNLRGRVHDPTTLTFWMSEKMSRSNNSSSQGPWEHGYSGFRLIGYEPSVMHPRNKFLRPFGTGARGSLLQCNVTVLHPLSCDRWDSSHSWDALKGSSFWSHSKFLTSF